MSEIKGKISRRQLLKMASPLGKVTLEQARCTGCGLCALECPTGALLILTPEDTGAYQLAFKHNLCLACDQCVEVCPEKCLNLERTMEMGSFNSPATVLFEDEVVRCPDCGKPFASRAMINSIKAKLAVKEDMSSSQFELCPECKARGRFSQMRN
jgi:formate hydrogenlyase subunit 6/NADH:ubiquinone oxidoreductase subunit I